MKRILLFTLPSIFASCLSSEKDFCSCKIPPITDIVREYKKDKSNEYVNVNLEGGIEAGLIKKVVDAKINASSELGNSTSSIQEIYSEILAANPEITQKANLYRVIALAKCENVCQDESLSNKGKTDKKAIILSEFEKNIFKIIDNQFDKKRTISQDGKNKQPQDNNYENALKKEIEKKEDISAIKHSPIEENETKPIPSSSKTYIAKRAINSVELRIVGFTQDGNIAIVNFELENKDASNTVRDFSVYPEYQQLNDQNSNTFRSQRCAVGNLDYTTGNLPVKLIYGNVTKGLVEFNVGANVITKIAYLKIGLDINYFEFINIPIK